MANASTPSSRRYVLLDSGGLRKLEQLGSVRVVRPAANAVWSPSLPQDERNAADGIFERGPGGSGEWRWRSTPPAEWEVELGDLVMVTRPTGFGHLGFFPEQMDNWAWLRQVGGSLGGGTETLYLFAYSGGSSLALAQAGVGVTHLDAAKGMIEWAKRNLDANPAIPQKIRWITDDAVKFIERELRRGRAYDGIVLDPPSFGRGAKGEVWKIDDSLPDLLGKCRALMGAKAKFLLLSLHSQGYTPASLERLVASVMPGGVVEAGEMCVPEEAGKRLPAGIYARWRAKPA